MAVSWFVTVGVDPEPDTDPDVDFLEGAGGEGCSQGLLPSTYGIKPWCSNTKVSCIFHTSQFDPSSFSLSILSKSLAFKQSEGVVISIYNVL